MKSLNIRIALFLAVSLLVVSFSCGSTLHPKDGGSPQMKLSAESLRDGAIPDAMQWKKSAVFAASAADRQEFLEWLTAIPGGLDTVKVQAWEAAKTQPLDLYVLLGWSTSGADELRRAAVDSVVVKGKQVEVYLSRPKVTSSGGMMGTADMQFVGWKIPLTALKAGKYKARLLMRRDTVNITTSPSFKEEVVAGQGYQEAARLEFAVK